jgi:hypothetical protein
MCAHSLLSPIPMIQLMCLTLASSCLLAVVHVHFKCNADSGFLSPLSLRPESSSLVKWQSI